MDWKVEDQVIEHSELASVDEDESSETQSNGDNDNAEPTESERSTIRSELKSMSFAELLALKSELGSKVYNEAIFGADATTRTRNMPKQKPEFKRENKNRPRELTAKKQVPLFGSKKPTTNAEHAPRDPRFDSKCGEFDRDKFKEDYSFVNEIREKEMAELKTQLKKLKGDQTDEKKKVKMVLQRMHNQHLEEKKLKERKQARANERQLNRHAIKSEQKPFFVPKREQKAKDLVKQFEELKNAGKLNKHLEKRRKKNMIRDRKKYKFD